jgi:tetratricopeptide (TPR) repeat protein
LGKTDRPLEAVTIYAKIVEFWEQLLNDDPANVDYQQQVAKYYWNLASVREKSGQVAKAGDAYLKSGAAYGKLMALADLNKDDTDAQLCASVWRDLGDLHRARGQFQEANNSYHQSLSVLQKLPELTEGGGPYYLKMAEIQTSLGLLQAANGQLGEANKSYREALDLLQKQKRRYVGAYGYVAEQARLHTALGNLQWDAKQFAQATASYRQALAARETALRDVSHPTGPSEQQLVWFLATCPDLQIRNSPRAVQLFKQAAQRSPDDGPAALVQGAALLRAGEWWRPDRPGKIHETPQRRRQLRLVLAGHGPLASWQERTSAQRLRAGRSVDGKEQAAALRTYPVPGRSRRTAGNAEAAKESRCSPTGG